VDIGDELLMMYKSWSVIAVENGQKLVVKHSRNGVFTSIWFDEYLNNFNYVGETPHQIDDRLKNRVNNWMKEECDKRGIVSKGRDVDMWRKFE
jgi:hypothetical protein